MFLASCLNQKMVGLVRFELTTSCTPCKRATRLRYSPNKRRVTKTPRARRRKSFFGGAIHSIQIKREIANRAGHRRDDVGLSAFSPLSGFGFVLLLEKAAHYP